MNHCYVKTQGELDSLISKIRESKMVVLDTEFTRRVTYYPILSLVQVAILDDKKELFIIDALEDVDMSEFLKIIGDEKILKVLHSAKQDLQIFHKESNIWPKNVIDTQVMANLANLKFNCGYSYLVEKICGISLDKKEQNSDWQMRPLSESQVNYALLDVEYLHDLYFELHKKLQEINRVSWLEEEMEIFVKDVLSFDNEVLFKKFSFRDRSFREIELLKKLIVHREECAKQMDVPRRHFIRDEHLDKMVRLSKMPRKLSEKYQKEFQDILESEVGEKPKSITLDLKEIEAKKAMHKKAKRLIAKKAQDADIAANILLSAQQLKNLVEKKKEFGDIVFGWRYDLFGRELEKILNL